MGEVRAERLTAAGAGRRGVVLQGLLLLVLALGPERLAKAISLVTSAITFPATHEIAVAGDRYEVFNLELLMVYLIVVIGLNLLVQTGLLSIGHTAPFAVGAYFVSITTVQYGWSFYPALIAAAVLTGLLGLAFGIPSLRLGVFTFAMVTLGYAVVTQDLALQWQGLTGGGQGLVGVRMPSPFGDLGSFYWLVAACVALAYVIARNYLRSPLGRASAAVESSPIAAQSVGINVEATKLRAFAVSSAFAGVAGGLYAALLGFIAPDSFTLGPAILFVLMVLLGGAGTVAGPIVGAVILFRIPLVAEKVTNHPGDWSLLLYGAVLLVSIQFFPRGVMSGWAWFLQRISRAPHEVAARRRPAVRSVVHPVEIQEGYILEVDDVAKKLSGVRALDGISLKVAPGTVHALIGPNGSGKTTLLNVMSGYLEADRGVVRLLGRDVTSLSVHRRVGRGLARTFQTPYVFEGVACRENVMAAADFHRRSRGLAYVARFPTARAEERSCYARTLELLDAVGLGEEVSTPAGQLPPGERRLLELARVLALEPRVVLMDEPAAGLSSAEIADLEESIRALRAAGVAVLLVEHHVEFVLRLADEVTVLDFGQVIARGAPSEVRDNPAVLAAYLGEPDIIASAGQHLTATAETHE